MYNALLANLLDSILGDGDDRKSTNDRKYFCPFCKHHKKKLEVQLITNENGENPWACWSCNEKGKTINSLFRKLKVGKTVLTKLESLVKTNKTKVEKTYDALELPAEFKSLLKVSEKDILGRHALIYIKNRGLTEYDILKYNIGYCDSGKYEGKIIMPSYDSDNVLNFFVARSSNDSSGNSYDNPKVSKNIIPFENFINWDVPVNLCEGFFDMTAIKRNCIPLLGKFISEKLMIKLLSSSVKKIYISLDNDALRQALRHAETLLSYNKKVYLVELSDKDPSKMGFEEYTKLVQTAKPLTLSKIMQLKFKL